MTAAEAHPVWLAGTGPHTLCLAARALQAMGSKPPGVRVAALSNVAHILIDALGRQHVIVRCGAAYMHLVISGSAVVIGPVILGATPLAPSRTAWHGWNALCPHHPTSRPRLGLRRPCGCAMG